MACKTWIEDGKIRYQVKVRSRAPGNRAIEVMKQETGELKGVAADMLETDDVKRRLQRIEMRLFGDARAELAARVGAGMTWGKFLELWEKEVLFDKLELEVLQLSERSAEGYRQALLDHTLSWKKKAASEITAVDFEILKHSMMKTGYSNSTIYNVKSAINCAYKWGIKKRYIPHVSVPPTYGCIISRKNARRPEILNFSQICKLLEEAEARNHPWFPIWKLVLYTGMRSGEAYALKVQDICLEEKRIVLDTKFAFDSRREEQLKDHEWRQVPVNTELELLFQDIGISQMAQNDHVLPRINEWRNGGAARVLRSFCEEIGIKSVCFHTLRACWATQLLRNGVAQSKVMIMGGWADLETMQVYLRRAGVEIEGGTDSLNFSRRERPARVLKLLPVASLDQDDDEIYEKY